MRKKADSWAWIIILSSLFLVALLVIHNVHRLDDRPFAPRRSGPDLVNNLLPTTMLAAGRDRQRKLSRVGLLMLYSADRPQIRGFRDGLRDSGYVEGQNLLLHMTPGSTLSQLHAIARIYREMKIDVIVAGGAVETRVAKDVIPEIPVMFMPAAEPIESGFIKSFARPGTNMTGIAFSRDVKEHGKRLQIFKEVVPTATRIIVLYDDRHPASTMSIQELRRVAYHLDVELSYLPVNSMSDAERAVSSIKESEAKGVFLICTSLFADPTKPATVAKRKKMPFHSCTTDHVMRGTTPFAYARDFYSIGRRGAWYVDQILTGVKPHQLPVEIPLTSDFVINLQTSKQIGLTVPWWMLMQANKVIQ